MKQLILQKLELTQFQRFDYYQVEFSPKETNVSGDNGTGKTTIYSAMMWLMFGKDAYGRKEFDVRRKVGGKINYEADAEVTGYFSIITDGVKTDLKLHRVLHGVCDRSNTWHDETQCYVDDVPKQVNEYNDFVNSIVPEEEFKMLTSVNYFLSKDIAEQREYLCRMAGVREVKDIISDYPRLINVYNQKPDKQTIEDFIKCSKASLKQWKEDKATIQPSIKALINSKPQERNWIELEKQKKEKEEEVKSIKEQLSSIDASVHAKVAERTKVYEAKAVAQEELSTLKKNAKKEIEARRLQADQVYDYEMKIYKQQEAAVKNVNEKETTLKSEIEAAEAKLARIESEMNVLLDEYNTANEQRFSVICPLIAGRECNEVQGSKRQAMEEAFEKAKQERMASIMRQGRALNAQLDDVNARIEKLKKELEDAISEKAVLTARFERMVLPQREVVDEAAIMAQNAEKIAKIEVDIKSLEDAYSNFIIERNDTELSLRHDAALKEITEIVKLLANKEQIARIDQQIEELTERGKMIADKVAEYTNLVDDLQEINRMVIDDASTRINAMFQITQWETSVQLKNGNYRDVCKPTVDGISASLNTATRINVGLDIIEAISNYNEIKVPLFIDNRETINKLVNLTTQVINLRVAAIGSPLTITK